MQSMAAKKPTASSKQSTPYDLTEPVTIRLAPATMALVQQYIDRLTVEEQRPVSVADACRRLILMAARAVTEGKPL